MATINMHMKFEIGIPKETWLMLRKPCLQTDGRTDGRMDRRTRWIQYTPPPTSLGGGINTETITIYIYIIFLLFRFSDIIQGLLRYVMAWDGIHLMHWLHLS